MSTLTEIELAIEALPPQEVDELAAWLESRRHRSVKGESVERWLERARGVAMPGMKTDVILAQTRGE